MKPYYYLTSFLITPMSTDTQYLTSEKFAELEKETLRTRLLEGRRRADATDRAYAVEPRYGRRVVAEGETELVEAPEEARAVARICELRETGMSYRAIGEALLEEDIRPRRAETWAPNVIQRIATGQRPPREKKSSSARTARERAEILATGGQT